MRNFLFILILCSSGLMLPAQEAYFWSGTEKMSLVPDLSTRCVWLKKSGEPDKQQVISLTSASRSTGNEDMLRSAGIAPADVAAISTGYRIGGGMKVWLTPRILYKPAATFSAEAFRQILQRFPGATAGATATGIAMIELGKPDAVLPLANALSETGMFEWCHPDFLAPTRAMSPPPSACLATDPLFSYNYYLHNVGGTDWFSYPYFTVAPDIDIDAPEAWCLTQGSSSVTVAIVDEGVEAHEDLVNGLGVSRVLPGYSTSTPLTGNGSPIGAEDAHGMAVAGIISASHNSLGIAGIAPEVTLLPIHVFIDGLSPISHYGDAINYAWQNGAHVINNSWAYDTCVTYLFPVIDQAVADALAFGRGGLGCIISFSTGQTDDPDKCVAYPALLPGVLAVGAIDLAGSRPAYARYGANLDIVAPTSPTGIANLTIMDRMGNLGYNYDGIGFEQWADRNYSKWFGGTSASCAQASGVAALMLSVNPGLTSTEVLNILRNSATDMGPVGFDNDFGYGRLNAYEAVLAATPTSFPVEWLSFEGTALESGIVLGWTTATEQNNDFFVVERREGNDFVELGRVAGAGDSRLPASYQFKDSKPASGYNVYRLRQVDRDGRNSLSPLVEVLFGQQSGAFVSEAFPSPATEQVYLSIAHLTGEANLRVTDLNGRIWSQSSQSLRMDTELLQIDVSNMPAGVYLFSVQTAEGAFTRKMVVAR